MKNKASEADRLNELRAKGFAQPDAGSSPSSLRPKRKKGFHRAVKRKETWALLELSMKQIMNNLARMMYETTYDSIMKPSPFIGLLKSINKDKELSLFSISISYTSK